MIKNTIILILLILLVLASYLLFNSGGGILGSRSNGDQIGGPKAEKSDGAYKAETLKPKPTPKIHTDPTVGLELNITEGEEGVDAGTLVFRYNVIHPSVLKVTDSEGNTTVEVNLETGKTVFGSGYTPDEASIEFWKSIGTNYPEICTMKKETE